MSRQPMMVVSFKRGRSSVSVHITDAGLKVTAEQLLSEAIHETEDRLRMTIERLSYQLSNLKDVWR